VIEIDGVKTYVALWEKVAQSSGKQYLQISEDKRAAEKAAGGPAQGGGASKFRRPAPTSPKPNDMDDDIPFITREGVF
jgi:hypothetical protein